jgi:ATP-dependent RNA helicase SUPV3L1/SUV3
MTSCIAFTADDLLSGHGPIHSKYLQEARSIALDSQSLFWMPTELLAEIISRRGKLTLNRAQGIKWPFQIINGRNLAEVGEEDAQQMLATGTIESALSYEPKAIQSGTRLMRLLSYSTLNEKPLSFKSSLKFRSEWHHDYQYHPKISQVARLFWLGLSADLVNRLTSSRSFHDYDERLLVELADGERDYASTTILIDGISVCVKKIGRGHLFDPDLIMSMAPGDPLGFASVIEFNQALARYVQEKVDRVFFENAEALNKLPAAARTSLVSTLHAFQGIDGFSQATTLAVNRHLHETDICIGVSHRDSMLEMPQALCMPSDRILNDEQYEELLARAQNKIDENYRRLKSWAGAFDLNTLEPFVLIKLLKMKQKQMKASFVPLRNRLQGAKQMNELMQNDPRFSHYHDTYPARHINREWIAYLGPTNSGKTHSGMQEMASVTHGIYLSPLRLMALENQERLEEMGIPCSLVTGEEEVIREGATHYCCTVEEFARFKRQHWDVVVVDEVQMLTDEQRGWAWTDALVSAYTPRLIMTGPALIKPSLERLAALCEDTFTVVEKKRLTPLGIAEKPENMEKIPKGSIIVAFSRKTVLDIKHILDMKGRTTAVVYGALSPVVRREQARRFRDGEAEIMIATDAIGMGLNLPAHSIYFYADKKFDGSSVRTLSSQEVKQIGGRAGRYGLSERGKIGAFSAQTLATINSRFKAKDKEIDLRKFAVRPGYEHLSTITQVTHDNSLLNAWLTFIRTVNYGESFVAVLPTELMEWIRQIDNVKIDLELRWMFACTPVHGGIEGYASQWLQEWLRCLHKGKLIVLPDYPPEAGLKGLEDAQHMIDAYLHLARALPDAFNEKELAETLRELFNDKTLKALSQSRAQAEPKRKMIP